MKARHAIFGVLIGALLISGIVFHVYREMKIWGKPTSNVTSYPNNTPVLSYKEEFTVTAYCPCEKCCGNFADGITANGHRIVDGDRFVAAPKSFTFGTIMNIPGYGTVAVKDRGGAIKGNKLDVFFNTHQEALNWGVKKLTVTVFVK